MYTNNKKYHYRNNIVHSMMQEKYDKCTSYKVYYDTIVEPTSRVLHGQAKMYVTSWDRQDG